MSGREEGSWERVDWCEYLEDVEIKSRMLNTLKGRIHKYIWRGNFNEPRPMNEVGYLLAFQFLRSPPN
jgi:hypothetical protein